MQIAMLKDPVRTEALPARQTRGRTLRCVPCRGRKPDCGFLWPLTCRPIAWRRLHEPPGTCTASTHCRERKNNGPTASMNEVSGR